MWLDAVAALKSCPGRPKISDPFCKLSRVPCHAATVNPIAVRLAYFFRLIGGILLGNLCLVNLSVSLVIAMK